MKNGWMMLAMAAVLSAGVARADGNPAEKWDPRMAVDNATIDTNGVKWIDGRFLPLEGRVFGNTDHYYDRLPADFTTNMSDNVRADCLTTNVNGGVRSMKHHTSGMMFRFKTNSKKLRVFWKPYNPSMAMDHMPATGVSSFDVYRQGADGKWTYVMTGRSPRPEGKTQEFGWTPGTPCLINLPLYNGIREFRLGIDKDATIEALPPRKSGVTKPVVFYGTSITHGGCCSRPGLGFVNIVGRQQDVPVVGLGFSGCGLMEFEMSEHLAKIDASCYILDCLWNMGFGEDSKHPSGVYNGVTRNYEPFIRNLRAKRPGVPIIMAEQCDVRCGGPNEKDRFIRKLYEQLVKEGWTELYYLPKTNMYNGDGEGTVDGCHPNDWGMMSMAAAFGGAVKEALKLK